MLIGFWITAWAGLRTSVPELAVVGLLLSTSAPIAFFIGLYAFKQPRTQPHPVWVSGLSGLGAVMIMVTIYRFGDQHLIWMGGALAALVGWMLYLKLFRLPIDRLDVHDSEQDKLE